MGGRGGRFLRQKLQKVGGRGGKCVCGGVLSKTETTKGWGGGGGEEVGGVFLVR